MNLLTIYGLIFLVSLCGGFTISRICRGKGLGTLAE